MFSLTKKLHNAFLRGDGESVGMYDELVVVFDIGESIDNYIKFIEENNATLPFTNMRIHPIIVP